MWNLIHFKTYFFILFCLINYIMIYFFIINHFGFNIIWYCICIYIADKKEI